MTNKITINGVEIELTDEQAKAVYGAVPEKEENKNPYDIDCIKEIGIMTTNPSIIVILIE